MLPLFGSLGDGSALPTSGIEELMMTMLASDDMADEPELEGIIIDPMLCADTFADVAQEMGIDPQDLGLSEEEREEIQMQILEESTKRILTEELCQEILKGLNALRLRLKRSGQRNEAARAAALQLFLSEKESEDIWPMLGLTQAIFHRSLAIAFNLIDASREVIEAEGLAEGEGSLLERLAQSSMDQKADELLKKIPGLRGYVEKQADEIWEEGVEAIFMGELYLGLFTQEELLGGIEIFAKEVGYDSDTGMISEEAFALPEEAGRTLVLRLDEYVEGLFTAERLEQLRVRLDVLLKEKANEKCLAFILMLVEYMKDEDAVENEKEFLIKALLGEMRAVASVSVESDE